MKAVLIVACTLVLLGFSNKKIEPYPKDYFSPPVNRNIRLSGTFGELRSNHFHAGLDIKSINGKSGEKIYAAAGGYISRIKVSPGGYGNALYIAHPNGYTTVYAHLDRFVPAIAKYVKEQQYRRQNFSVDLYTKEGMFNYEKGELIGYMGNSGGSYGAHLHFEIRHTDGQTPINPLHFGIALVDGISPDLTHLNVHYFSGQHEQIDVKTYPVVEVTPGVYEIPDTLVEGAWRVGFSLATTDRMDNTRNRNGIYALSLTVDSEPEFSFSMDEFSFSRTRYLNAHIDYAAAQSSQRFYHRCHLLDGNKQTIYDLAGAAGFTQLYQNQPRQVVISSADFNGNTSSLTFYIKRDSNVVEHHLEQGLYHGKVDKSLTISPPGMDMQIPAGAFYQPHYIKHTADSLKPDLIQHTVGSQEIALHRYVDLTLDLPRSYEAFNEKVFIGLLDADGELVNCGGEIQGSRIQTRVREFGTFHVGIDTTSPEIRPVSFRSDMTQLKVMKFKITDNIATGGSASGLEYYASVDGEWILMEYDAKNDLLTHRFDGRISTGRHQLKIVVTDDRGNQATLQRTFMR